jgi:diacylglycerol kinase (ATP)
LTAGDVEATPFTGPVGASGPDSAAAVIQVVTPNTTVTTRRSRDEIMKNQPFLSRVSFATSGIVAAWRRERSFRTQVVVAGGVIAVTAALRPGLIWGATVTFAIVLVLALELVNSAVESLIDFLHPQTAPEIKLAKDVAAGAVLVATIGAVVVGVLMLIDTLA